MKKLLALGLVLCLAVMMMGCGIEKSLPSKPFKIMKEFQSECVLLLLDSKIYDAAWQNLEELGNIQTVDGVQLAAITLPDFSSEDAFPDNLQDTLDEIAGYGYTSVIENNDGTLTYLLTRAQFKRVIAAAHGTIITLLLMTESDDSVTDITYNDDFSQYDITFDKSVTDSPFIEYSNSILVSSILYRYYIGLYDFDIVINYLDSQGNIIKTESSRNFGW